MIDRDGEPWFVAADVCRALDLPPNPLNGSVQDHMRRLDADEVSKAMVPGHRQAYAYYIVSESGLYSLILRSRKPEAQRFRKWVTSEVLPAIRKTGSYTAPRTPRCSTSRRPRRS